ncbi:MAG: pyridoxal-dependent decarboxylase [Bacteroidales bacterium]|nr:DegT/DnrJ/EryC1/StrS family aminotransferase [Lentimicrobiaceae bacterium]MDD5694524.1 pyridoxal-dependent decarboxylase [Bacteroidales bacterium]
MITSSEFRFHAHQFVDWMADYLENVEQLPVKSPVVPGEIYRQIPDVPPEESEPIEKIMQDFQKIILPGMTHWQSPNFFAYFPANSSYPSVLGEMLTATLGAQCMVWETSPAAAELEEKMMHWLRQMTGLPATWDGVIQDTASSSTLIAILSAREKYSGFQVNETGIHHQKSFRVYCTSETHSSLEKAVKIAGLGKKNLIRVDVDEQFGMRPEALQQAIELDLKNGKAPLAVVATIGTTSSTAIDPLPAIARICKKYDVWLHVDAALAGTALVLPEYRWMIGGIEDADSFVFNPHKWMFTNFDCSAYFIRDRETLIRTFAILPEYLKTRTRGMVNDYRDWGIALGRRFRALKLWFVLRNFGIQEIQNKVRMHIALAQKLATAIEQHPDFEVLVKPLLNTVCFRYKPAGIVDETELNELNERLLNSVNATGRMFISHTRLKGKYTLRMVIAQTYAEERHVLAAWDLIRTTSSRL